jgi:hypothetical protein
VRRRHYDRRDLIGQLYRYTSPVLLPKLPELGRTSADVRLSLPQSGVVGSRYGSQGANFGASTDGLATRGRYRPARYAGPGIALGHAGRRPEPVPAPRRPAVEAPRPELHLHFHGVTAEDVAAILADVNRDRG